jgi:signal transduction histidine kinase
VRSSIRQLFAVTAAISLGLALAGTGWNLVRFGWGDSGAARLETEVRRLIDNRARQVRSLARRVADDGARLEAAAATPEGLAALFASLTAQAQAAGTEGVSATVYVPAGPRGAYRVLAWSEGPAEDVSPDRLAGPAALFIERGTSGLRLVYSQPVERDGRRLGVATAETTLSPAERVGAAPYRLTTSFGPVVVIPPPYAGASAVPSGSRSFLIGGGGDRPLLEVRFSGQELAERRRLFHRRIAGVALLPFALLTLLLTGRVVAQRARAKTTRGFIAWSVAAALLVAGATAGVIGLCRMMGVPGEVSQHLLAWAALGAAALLPGSLWWRSGPRLRAFAQPVRFVVEHLLGGVALAGALVGLSLLFQSRINASTLDEWQSPLLPVAAGALLFLCTLLLAQMAIGWAIASTLGVLASRWRVALRRPAITATASLLWVLPPIALLAWRPPHLPRPWIGWVTALAAVVIFGWLATVVRRYYRRTTQAIRLVLVFAALLLPPATLYPLAAFYAEATTRDLIAGSYAPAAMDHPRVLRRQLAQAMREIDQIGGLNSSVVAPGPAFSTQAYIIWNQTTLAQSRVTSDIEIFAADRSLVSRFALNVPEYLDRSTPEAWQGSGCVWRSFDELRRFGAEERVTLRAERGMCDLEGRLIGAIVVHVVPDYQALPFFASDDPYTEALRASAPAPRQGAIDDLQVAIYGWSLHASAAKDVAWAITGDLFRRLYQSREPFWTRVTAAEREYEAYFTSDRTRIYSLGYPRATPFDHATRLAETGAITALIFFAVLVGATAYTPFADRREAPLRALLNEIRTSLYRKLFLFFVLAAVGPVVLLALAFGAYMTDKFRADVQSEAANVVTVARRVLEEIAAAGQHSDQQPPPPTDEVMVWVGQAIDQDVNLFEGPTLVATSQRDLFDSGLLPTRTPASAYRAIALDRLPTFVAHDRLGEFEYLVAAAPMAARGRDAVLSVPLALRQREIEREIDELNRGVLVGAVVVLLFAAGLGASVAGRISDPIARLTRATREIAEGRLDVRIVADTADELRRLVDDFNSMAATLGAQRVALARANQLQAWNERARQVAHEIKNPLTPIQLAAEHLQRVHEDEGRPLGALFDHCVSTILRQVRLLRQIAGEFANFAGEQTPRITAVALPDLLDDVVAPYRAGLDPRHRLEMPPPGALPLVLVDRTLIARALTNLVENAWQAMPEGGTLRISAESAGETVRVTIADTGVGMDADAVQHAFEPYFSTKTAGSGLGLPNAKRNIELCGGRVALASEPGRGTTVTVTLPAAPAPAGSRRGAPGGA